MFKPAFAAAALLAFVPAATAQAPETGETAIASIGPQVGVAAPAFAAVSATGAAVDLTAIGGEHGAVIVFSRSLDWCPYCKKQALDLQPVAEQLAAAGWPLSLITYDSPETLAAYQADKSPSYTLLSDTGSAMIDAFNLRNTDVAAGSRFDGIPHPAIVLISADGIVRAVLREEGFKVRPPSESLPPLVALLNAAPVAD